MSGRAGFAGAGSGNEHGGLRGVPARAGRSADAARGLGRRAGRALGRGRGARAVRPSWRVDGALARAAGGGRRDRGLRRRVRPQVPPGRRLLDQGAAEGGTWSRGGLTTMSDRVDLLLSLADDELILGWRNSEWTGIAPSLEEDVAFSSIAQNEIGHARALYELAARERGTSADALAFDRAPEEYRCSRLVELRLLDWEK